MTNGEHIGRVWLPWTLTVSLVVLGVAFAGLGSVSSHIELSSNPPVTSFAPSSGFGGYGWNGPVHEISAQWRVPSVLSSSKPGTALVWIGAQARNNGGAFIQLGSFAYLPKPSLPLQGGQYAQSDGPSYGVFWSDAAQRFKPIDLLGLMHSGDLIYFQMLRNAHGWRLTVKNLTFNWTHSIEVSYGARDLYNQAEWLQEDPAAGVITDRDAPYADISTVTFEHLKVNNHRPDLNFADAQALATDRGVYLVPTQPMGNQFSLLPARGATRQYLKDAEEFEAASEPIALQIVKPSDRKQLSPMSIAEILVHCYGVLDNQLRTQRWPDPTRPAITQVMRDIGGIRFRIAGWAKSKDATTGALRRIVGSATVHRDLTQLRESLGLPPD
jgi:hypothetical protein